MVPRVPRFPFYRPLPAGHQGESGMDRRLLKVTRLIHPSPLSSSRISFSSPSPSLSFLFFFFKRYGLEINVAKFDGAISKSKGKFVGICIWIRGGHGVIDMIGVRFFAREKKDSKRAESSLSKIDVGWMFFFFFLKRLALSFLNDTTVISLHIFQSQNETILLRSKWDK